MTKAELNPKIYDPEVEQAGARDGYGQGLLELGEKDKNVVVLTADLAESTRVEEFGKKFPDRFIECGVAEQNMMGIAAGLALTGKTPFVSSYAVFSPGRSWDQLRVSVCYTQANVKVAGAHTGISVGPDGATHQALEDIAIVRVLPNITVVVPCDVHEARKTTLAAAEHKGPFYFRFGREKTPIITTAETPFKIGEALTLRDGDDVTIIACGSLVYQALLAAEQLVTEGISARVVNNHTIKPIDKLGLAKAAKETGAVVTVEEHQINGGLGGAVAETLAENYPVPIERVGMPDTFGESGAPGELLEKYGMSVKKIKEAVKSVLKRKDK
ncbi:MAG: transketolase [Candidatus Woykebacteria bacterium RIFCSPHIGHO2_12_FULL_45_10]|uniref:Transketolase n=1 Tax=Candidatus Woykebacteria bacterium RIFCSPHIGHO2_12_FULL_45_10 TaxID=1802603 RepID=A0A1G1WQ86_9BACT|nr:MAG: transketolase [Candidatus Woykebacteria bacterium RIFCSPHIGHO2_12_FULL_45_10]